MLAINLNEKCSTLIGRTSYVGFFIDWFIELICFATVLLILIASGSIYIGISLYIIGMVEDLKMRIPSIDSDFVAQLNPASVWSIYVKEIDHHVEIIK